MENLRLKPTALMSDKNFVRQVGASTTLYDHLIGAGLDEFATEYEPIVFKLHEVKENSAKKFFADDEFNLPQYPATVGNYEFALELLYDLTQLQYAKDFHNRRARAQELFVAGKIDEALPILRELAAADDARARYILALIYNEGINVERDADYVRELLTANIAAGDACSIVYSHVRGPDVPANVCKAAYAAIKNSADVLERHAAAIFLNSFDYHDKAIHELEQACAEGFFLAAHELGCKYYYGRDGVAEDNKTARKYFEQAAAAGYGQSMFILGEMYQKGFGVPVDKKRAVDYYVKAYERHSTSDDAINFIGSFYDDKKIIRRRSSGIVAARTKIFRTVSCSWLTRMLSVAASIKISLKPSTAANAHSTRAVPIKAPLKICSAPFTITAATVSLPTKNPPSIGTRRLISTANLRTAR